MSRYRICPNCREKKFRIDSSEHKDQTHFEHVQGIKRVSYRTYGRCVSCLACGYVDTDVQVDHIPDTQAHTEQFELKMQLT